MRGGQHHVTECAQFDDENAVIASHSRYALVSSRTKNQSNGHGIHGRTRKKIFHRRVTKNAEKNFNLKNTQAFQIKSEAAKFNLPLNSF
jgi:hypothetical protein